jgi:hypothetical protein
MLSMRRPATFGSWEKNRNISTWHISKPYVRESHTQELYSLAQCLHFFRRLNVPFGKTTYITQLQQSLQEFASIIWAFAWLDAADEASSGEHPPNSGAIACNSWETWNRGWFGTKLNMFPRLVSGYKRLIQFHLLIFVAPLRSKLASLNISKFYG